MTWFKNLQVYRIPAPWAISAEQLEAFLAPQAFAKCSSLELQSQGWLSPRDNGKLVHAVNRQMMILLGTDKKLLPPSVINQVAGDLFLVIAPAGLSSDLFADLLPAIEESRRDERRSFSLRRRSRHPCRPLRTRLQPHRPAWCPGRFRVPGIAFDMQPQLQSLCDFNQCLFANQCSAHARHRPLFESRKALIDVIGGNEIEDRIPKKFHAFVVACSAAAVSQRQV